ncbi:NUDIX hydrolase [Aliiroseovarius sp. KMU-50]|uniref:NUDIX hydrolase n=1 Tax=Aliiroseovarius salicola TaxID=3009082 RepID=A0ABT4VWS0_9RHOB|nr:NUDIX hydrolase [Aliiroseovarius sp. KMU-50]MDA5092694.1 NUDIX hydrolase [Aliiroseovarius sp. KMU-50]
MEPENGDFTGAKLVLLIGDRLVTLLRDDREDIPWPGFWDLPGGARENGESAEECVLRETYEEIGLHLAREDLCWKSQFPSHTGQGLPSWWFAAQLPREAVHDVRFGNEGQGWDLVLPETWLADARSIPHFKPRIRLGLAALAATPC